MSWTDGYNDCRYATNASAIWAVSDTVVTRNRLNYGDKELSRASAMNARQSWAATVRGETVRNSEYSVATYAGMPTRHVMLQYRPGTRCGARQGTRAGDAQARRATLLNASAMPNANVQQRYGDMLVTAMASAYAPHAAPFIWAVNNGAC